MTTKLQFLLSPTVDFANQIRPALRSEWVEVDGGSSRVRVTVEMERETATEMFPARTHVEIAFGEGNLARGPRVWNPETRWHDHTTYAPGTHVIETHDAVDDTPGAAAREAVTDALDCYGLLEGYRVAARKATKAERAEIESNARYARLCAGQPTAADLDEMDEATRYPDAASR